PPRLRRGGPSDLGSGGHVGAPQSQSNGPRGTRAAPALPGRPERWGSGGHVGAPSPNQTVREGRGPPRLCRGGPNDGGSGGHVGAPSFNQTVWGPGRGPQFQTVSERTTSRRRLMPRPGRSGAGAAPATRSKGSSSRSCSRGFSPRENSSAVTHGVATARCRPEAKSTAPPQR